MTPPEPLFLQAEAFDAEALNAGLPEPWRLKETGAESRAWHLADTFDNQLWKKERLLLVAAEGSGCRLLDGALPGPVLQLRLRLPRVLRELPDSLVAELPADPKRALLPGPELAIDERWLCLLDDEDKTQARIQLCRLQLGEAVQQRLALHPLRGYERAFDHLQQTLKGVCPSLADSSPTALLRSLDYCPRPYVSKPDFVIDEKEPAQPLTCRLCHSMLEVARANEEGIRQDLDSEFLHDFRVSLRRARSVISLLKGVFPEPTRQELRQSLAALMKPTNRLRDLDVYLLEEDSYRALLPDHLQPGLDALFEDFAQQREEARQNVTAWIGSQDYLATRDSLLEFFRDASPRPAPKAETPAGKLARKALQKRYAKVCRQAAEITPETPDEAVHQLRIQCKKLRYLLEFFAPLLASGPHKKLVKALKKLQDNLGDFNDYSVQQDALRTYLEERATRGRLAPDLADALGALRLVLNQRQQQKRAELAERIQDFRRPEVAALLEQCLGLERRT